MNNPAGTPVFSCGNQDLERAFSLALETLDFNTRPVQSGLLREGRPCLMAGADYPAPWTRDAAINVWFAEAFLDPETAHNTLFSVLEERDGLPVVGGQYWDRIISALPVSPVMSFAGLWSCASGMSLIPPTVCSAVPPSTAMASPPILGSTGILPFPLPSCVGHRSILTGG